jgi:hypothetical protein
MPESHQQPARYKRKPRTGAQHVHGGNHVLYETQMFFNLAALLDDVDRWINPRGWEEKTLYMAVVESMLVHRRSLMDFYFPAAGYDTDRRRESDMFAADFCDSWAPMRPALFKDEWSAISEEILHLTYLRPEVASNWPYAQMRDELRNLTKEFTDAADERLHGYIKAQLHAIAFNEQRVGRAVTPKVETELTPVSPQVLSGLTPGLSTPTSAMLGSD